MSPFATNGATLQSELMVRAGAYMSNEELIGCCPASSNLGECLDLHQKIWANQLRHWQRRTFRRRRAEIALAQFGIFVEFDRLCDIAVRKNNVLDRSAARVEAGPDVLPNLLDLRAQIAFAHNIAGLVARDLPTHDDPMATIAQRDFGRGARR
jgi:hypothetical protein